MNNSRVSNSQLREFIAIGYEHTEQDVEVNGADLLIIAKELLSWRRVIRSLEECYKATHEQCI